MTTAIVLLVAAHAAALLGVLAAARLDCALVDEHGRIVPDTWHETTIPVATRDRVLR